ncbi:MAG: sulfotransferase [Anaerolineae bacterium]|nr:sulfotransferase [Caldilineales bacterium]MDW8270243.1 sulfotransferase [Anaerolineae bacterium]
MPLNLFSRRRPSPHRLPPHTVVIVSGLPRSGTSMMMKMLEAGGLPILSDGLRAADPDNPEGYYEFERVKQLDKGDTAWLAEAEGKAVKVISALLQHLPPSYQYRVIFMNRRMAEVLASQRKMLARRGERSDVDDAQLAVILEKHLRQVKQWLSTQPQFRVLEVDYNAMLADPQPYVRQINRFLDGVLDEARMAEVVNPSLYRNRAMVTTIGQGEQPG